VPPSFQVPETDKTPLAAIDFFPTSDMLQLLWYVQCHTNTYPWLFDEDLPYRMIFRSSNTHY